MFLACPAEMLLTLQLKTWTLPHLMGSVKVRSVLFMASRHTFSLCVREVLPDKTVTV